MLPLEALQCLRYGWVNSYHDPSMEYNAVSNQSHSSNLSEAWLNGARPSSHPSVDTNLLSVTDSSGAFASWPGELWPRLARV